MTIIVEIREVKRISKKIKTNYIKLNTGVFYNTHLRELVLTVHNTGLKPMFVGNKR